MNWQTTLSQLQLASEPNECKMDVAVRSVGAETDAVFAKGRSLRVVSLARAKSTANVEDIVQTLSPELPFDAKRIEINSSGKLAAVVGEFSVAVVVLPTKRLRMSDKEKTVKIHTIGDIYHADDTSPIVKVAWHPLSEGDCDLVILTADGWLRMYNISADPDEPEQSFCFSDQSTFSSPRKTRSKNSTPDKRASARSSDKKRGIFGIDLDEREAISFAFGPDGISSDPKNEATPNGWSAFTVYGLMKSGQVLAVCPFIPLRSTWSLRALNSLKTLNDNEWNASNGKDMFQAKQFYWRNRWLEEALENAQNDQQNSLPSDTIVMAISRNLATKLQPLRQGPFQIVGTDSANQQDDVAFASDLAVLSAGPLSAILTTYQNGVVNVALEIVAPEPKWDVPEEEDETTASIPSMFLYEEIQLLEHATSAKAIRLSYDPKYKDILYATHCEGVHLLSFSLWIENLTQAYKNGTGLAILTEKHVDSEIQRLIDTATMGSDADSIYGFSVVGDVLLGYSFIATTLAGTVLAKSLALRPSSLANPPIKSKSTVPKHSALAIHPYRSHIAPSFTIPKELSQNQPLVVPSSKSGQDDPPLDDALLRTLHTKITGMRSTLAAIKAAGHDVQNRLDDIQHEAITQHKHVQSYTKVLDEQILKRGDKIHERAEEIEKKQNILVNRADAIVQLLMELAQPQLSEAEKEFFQELKEFQSRVRSVLKPRLGQISKQKEVLLAQVKQAVGPNGTIADLSKSVGESNPSSLSSGQVKRIGEALSYEYSLLADTWKKVEAVKMVLEH
ncbi:hypothetical protein HDU77_003458 [Chytriomyces hyalinus]|nr:hypothetical protein HDU77_003458 [Chytriomyces hyalinus]